MFASKEYHKELLKRLDEETFMAAVFTGKDKGWVIKHSNHLKEEDLYYIKQINHIDEKIWWHHNHRFTYFVVINGHPQTMYDGIAACFDIEREYCAINPIEFVI